jgi:predicted nucleic acid-binding protein
MPRVAVPDTSCLIALRSVELLDLLSGLYDRIAVPAAVALEFGAELPARVTVVRPDNELLVLSLRQRLGAGESEVIALAAADPERIAILDDRKARSIARGMGVRLTGTLGVLLKAHASGAPFDLDAVLLRLRAVGFRMPGDFELR